MADGPAAHAGQLRDRIRFERRLLDDNGDRTGDFSPYYSCSARIQALRGGETVMGERLEGSQPVIITVRHCRAVSGLTTADSAVNARTGQRYDIKGVTPDERRVWTDILATHHAGGTVG